MIMNYIRFKNILHLKIFQQEILLFRHNLNLKTMQKILNPFLLNFFTLIILQSALNILSASAILQQLIVLFYYFYLFFLLQDTNQWEQFKQKILLSKQRKQLLTNFIYSLFSQFLKSKKNKSIEVYFSFISFLIDFQNNKVQSFIQIIKLYSSSNLSLKDKSIISYQYAKARQQFDLTFSSNKLQLEDISSQVQKGQEFQDNFFDGIKFDEEMSELEMIYFSALKEKEKFINLLYCDYINLIKLKEMAISYYELRQKTANQLKKLGQIHYSSQQLQYYMDRYISIMSFGANKRKLFQPPREQIDEKTQKMMQQQKKNNFVFGINIFQKDNCIVFITLINQVGLVKRAQNKFEKMFGFSLKEVINQNISLIIPSFIATHHNNLLIDYSINNFKNQEKNSFPLLLAQNKKGWAVPVSIQLRSLNNGFDDFGIFAHLQKIKNSSIYIMTSCNNFNIQLISEEFYERYISYYCASQKVQKIFLNRIIPILPYFEIKQANETNENKNIFTTIQTLAFLPKIIVHKKILKGDYGEIYKNKMPYIFDSMEFDKLSNDLKAYSGQFMDIFHVMIKFQFKASKYFEYNIIEILEMKKVSELSEQKLLLEEFTHQMSTLLNVQFPLTSELNRINDLIEKLKRNSEKKIENEFDQLNFTLRSQDIKGNYNIHNQSGRSFQQDQREDQQQSISSLDNVRLKVDKNIEYQEFSHDNTNKNQSFDLKSTSKHRQFLDSLQFYEKNDSFATESKRLRIENELTVPTTSITQRFNQNQVLSSQPYNLSVLQDITSQNYLSNYSEQVLYSVEHLNSRNGFLFEEKSSKNLIFSKKNCNQILLSKEIEEIDKLTFNEQSTKKSYYLDNKDQNKKKFNSSSIKKGYEKEEKISDEYVKVKGSSSINSLNQQMKIIRNSMTLNKLKGTTQSSFERDYLTIQNLDNNAQYDKFQYFESEFASKIDGQSQRHHNSLRIDQASSSIISSKSKNHKLTSTLKKQISSRKNSLLMQLFTLFGFFSLMVIMTLSLGQFLYSLLQFSLAKEYFAFLPWPMNLRGEYVFVSSKFTTASFIKLNAFPRISENNFEITTSNSLRDSYILFIDLYKKFQNSDQSRLKFLNLLNDNMNFLLSIDDLVSVNPFIYNLTEKTNRTIAISQFIEISAWYLYKMHYIQNDSLVYQKFLVDNFPEFNAKLLIIQSEIQNQTINIIERLLNQETILLILVLVISVILISSVIPLYAYFQMKNEKVLKLFATIQPEQIKQILVPIKIALSENKIKQPSLKFHQGDAVNKKKVLSTTSSLPKFKFIFLICSFIAIIAIIIQPITNFIFISSFKKEAISDVNMICKIIIIFQINIKFNNQNTLLLLLLFMKTLSIFKIFFLVNLYDIKASFISSLSINFSIIQKMMYPNSQVYNLPYFLMRTTQLIKSAQSKLQIIYSTVQQTHSRSKFSQNNYDNFFFEVFEGNMCQSFKSYPQFVTQENYLSYDDCSSIRKGMFAKGFNINSDFFLQNLQNWYQMYQNKATFSDSIILWESQIGFQEFNKFYNSLFKVINIIKDFMIAMMNDQIEFMKKITTLLIIFQVIALISIYFFGWIKFYIMMIKEIFLIKNLISMLPINIILSNPYISQFLNKN